MIYPRIRPAVFISRPNRFIANIDIDGSPVVCHVKNTGRCRELLTPGARILVQENSSPIRKTAFDLISVWKGDRLINMDAQAPNKVFGEFLAAGGMGFVPELIRPECTHGDSRFDFYYEHDGRRVFAEIKGVTLEMGGVVSFPDAPTQRGIKHLHGLIRAVEEGFDACAVFIVQMGDVKWFEPSRVTHPGFADALKAARDGGVDIFAFDCSVTENSLEVNERIEVKL